MDVNERYQNTFDIKSYSSLTRARHDKTAAIKKKQKQKYC